MLDFEITQLVNQNIINKARKSDRDYSYFHASEWDRCNRQKAYLYYVSKGILKFNEESTIIDPKLQRCFDNGHYLHDRWKHYIEATGALVGYWKCKNFMAHPEPKIYGKDSKLGVPRPEKCECGSTKFSYEEVGFHDEETWWGGHVDAVVNLGIITSQIIAAPKIDELMIIDFKSINNFSYKTLTQPKSEHNTQMQIYLYLSGLNYGKFIYEDKGSHGVKEYLVIRDDAFIAVKKEEAIQLKERLTKLNSQGKHVLPPRAYATRSHANCVDCKFRGTCWGT